MREASAVLPKLLSFAALAAATGVAAGLGFALWSQQSAAIFLSLVDAGISWCF